MSADHHVQRALRHHGLNLALLPCGLAAQKQAQGHRARHRRQLKREDWAAVRWRAVASHQPADGVEVLLCENLRRRHERALPAVCDGREQSRERHDRLAAAHVALE